MLNDRGIDTSLINGLVFDTRVNSGIPNLGRGCLFISVWRQHIIERLSNCKGNNNKGEKRIYCINYILLVYL